MAVCTDCCDYVAISGAASVQSTSIFTKTNITWSNRPVYQNSNGQYLSYWAATVPGEDSEWTVGPDYGGCVIAEVNGGGGV